MPLIQTPHSVSRAGAKPAFLRHIQWSAEPEVAIYRPDLAAAGLPILALRHYRTRCTGAVEVLANVPQAEDWDALFVNRNGSGSFAIDFCGSRREIALHRDLCCFLPAGGDSRLRFNHDSGAFGIYFPPGVMARLLESESPRGAQPVPVIGAHHPRIAHLMKLVESELLRPSLGSSLMIEGLLRAIVGLLASGNAVPLADQFQRIHLSPGKLKRVIDFIEAHLHENIGLEDLARTAGLSANHFLRVFRHATGETPYRFLRSRRLERARILLGETTTPLAELALDCGFASQAHFTAAFSRELGIAPGRYRRALRS